MNGTCKKKKKSQQAPLSATFDVLLLIISLISSISIFKEVVCMTLSYVSSVALNKMLGFVLISQSESYPSIVFQSLIGQILLMITKTS